MAEPRNKTPGFPPATPANPPFTSGVPGFPDTFYGTRDKSYVDRKVKDMSRLRGTDVYYYKMKDQTERIDGQTPLSDGPEVIPEQTTRRRSGNMSLYGEPIIVKKRIDSTKREVVPDWNYAEPVLVRALAMQPSQEEEADERGLIIVRKVVLHIGRVNMEEVGIYPRDGDVIRLPSLLDSYYDVAHVDRDSHRFGAFGFFVAFKIDLSKKTLFDPQRKLEGGT
jgi:hypothetical protein